MIKRNSCYLIFVLMFFLCLKGYGSNGDGKPMDKKGKVSAGVFLNDVAIIYGVHAQLTKQEGVHIEGFDQLVEDVKAFLNKKGIGFDALMGDTDFINRVGKARICAHNFYAELAEIYEKSLISKECLVPEYCEELEGISLKKVIGEILDYIY